MKRKRDKQRKDAQRRAGEAERKRAQRRATAKRAQRRAAAAGGGASDLATAVNSCGGCAACCGLLGVPELDKAPGQACEHARIDEHGCCAIYAERPASCQRFLCHWAAGGLEAHVGLRPDRLGVMLGWEDAHEATGRPWFQAWEARPGGLTEPAARRVLEAVAREYVVAVMSKVPSSLRLPRLLGPPADIDRITAWVDARRPRP